MSDTFDHWGDAMNDLFDRDDGDQDGYESMLRWRAPIPRNKSADLSDSLDLLPNLDEEPSQSVNRCPFCGVENGAACGTGDCDCDPDLD